MRASEKKKVRRSGTTGLCARLRAHVMLEAHGSGEIIARFPGFSTGLGMFGADTAKLAQGLRAGVPVASLTAGKTEAGKELNLLVQRLARNGLIEYVLDADGAALVVIDPQVADYWPRLPELDNSDEIILSRFAFLRRRGDDFILESPRARATFKLCDPKIASVLAALSVPQKFGVLRRRPDFPGAELLRLLLDSDIVFKADRTDHDTLRLAEGDKALALWDFHDLLFHARSTEGRHADPIGGVYPHQGAIAALPAVRPSWPGKKIELPPTAASGPHKADAFLNLLHRRHSVRSFDNAHPITISELAQLLEGAARITSVVKPAADQDDGGHALRPYPSAGASYELELYVAVERCEGIAKGLYHYDASSHSLVPIEVPAGMLDALLAGAQSAMGASAKPQIVLTIAARFGRVAWKYSALAYSLILKDVGVLTQTLYLAATEMGLGGCAIGLVNVDLFEKMTGLPFHFEGPVGQFALGREAAHAK